jgi:hypothetical protein
VRGDRLGITTPASGARKPIQIQVEALRNWEPSAPFLAGRGFAALPEEPVAKSEQGQGEATWRDADLKRAIAVAEKSGLQSYRVEITPDGTILIVVGQAQDSGSGDD